MSYNQFAQTYDKLMDKSLYTQWARFVSCYAKTGDTILDVACGSGDLACLLEKHYNVLACDLSNDMLALASTKIIKTLLFQANMIHLKMDLPVDMITCFADSLCYLKNENQVKQAFSCAYQTLKDNGYYLFDVHSVYQMTQVFPTYCYQYVDDNTVFTWQSFVGKDEYSIEHELTCCNRLSNGLYERYDEIHYERTYLLKHYIDWLNDVGFSKVNVFSHFGTANVTDDSTRWFFVCQK